MAELAMYMPGIVIVMAGAFLYGGIRAGIKRLHASVDAAHRRIDTLLMERRRD